MKKIVLIFITVLLGLAFVACTNPAPYKVEKSVDKVEKSVDYNTSVLTKPSETESNRQGLAEIGPQKFDNEDEFVKALKGGKIASQFKPEKIKCYFKPKLIPEETTLLNVEVFSSYVMLRFTFDKTKKTDDASNQIMYKWYKDYGGYAEHFIDTEIKRGSKKINLKGQLKGTIYVAPDTFAESKETGHPAWTVQWIQDGECFGATVPFNIPEKDIAKYLDMKKIIIE